MRTGSTSSVGLWNSASNGRKAAAYLEHVRLQGLALEYCCRLYDVVLRQMAVNALRCYAGGDWEDARYAACAGIMVVRVISDRVVVAFEALRLSSTKCTWASKWQNDCSNPTPDQQPAGNTKHRNIITWHA
jgi:hypothetical protein